MCLTQLQVIGKFNLPKSKVSVLFGKMKYEYRKIIIFLLNFHYKCLVSVNDFATSNAIT